MKKSQDGLSSKMFPEFSTATKGKTSKFSSKSWMNSGMAFRGEYLTQNILEHPKDDVESSLSQVLEASAPLEYYLNPKELQSLIDRATAREKPLPTNLQKKIEKQIHILSNMPASVENLRQDLKQKDTEMTEKHTRSTQEVPRTLFVRRMLPSEYEKLQGFPKDWTHLDTEA